MLRSRTVRCLTKVTADLLSRYTCVLVLYLYVCFRWVSLTLTLLLHIPSQQIQKRCGDASLQLPPWSENTENEMIYDPNGSNSGPHLTTTKNDSPNTVLMKSENLANTIYDMNSNGFEKTFENNYDFDPNDNVFEEDSKSDISSQRSSNAHENEKETHVEDEEEKINVGVLSKIPKESSDAEISDQKSQTSSGEVKKGGKNIVPRSLLINSLRRGNFENSDNHSDFSNSPKNTKKRFVDSHKRDNGVQLFLNVSNFNSDESDGETSRVSTRHILKPVEEKVTIEVLDSKSSDVDEVSEKMFDGNSTHEDSNRDEVCEWSMRSTILLLGTVKYRRQAHARVCWKVKRIENDNHGKGKGLVQGNG